MSTNLISASNFNALQNNLDNNLYGNLYDAEAQTVANPVVTGQLIRASDWINLYADAQRAEVHQANTTPNFSSNSIAPGQLILQATDNSLEGLISTELSYYLYADPSQLQTISKSVTYHAATNTEIIVNYTWSNAAQAKGFFNLGGSIFTSLAPGLAFTASNYNATVNQTIGPVTHPTTDGLGTQQVTISGYGNTFEIVIQLDPNVPGHYTTTTGYMSYVQSISPGGNGIFAFAPQVTAGLSFTTLSLQTITGDTVGNASMSITNNGSSVEVITGIEFIPDPTLLPNELTFTYSIVEPTLYPGASTPVSLSWQNLTTQGGLFNNQIQIQSNIGTANFVNPVVALFGLDVSPTSYSATVTTDATVDFAIEGYGGVLDEYSIAGTASGQGFSFIDRFVEGADIPLTFLSLDTTQVPNGTTSSLVIINANDTAGDVAPTVAVNTNFTVDVTDTNLGHWQSSLYEDNGVVGFSYDILNGVKYLTYGFGWGGGGSVNTLVGYETSVLSSTQLGTKQLAINQLNGNGVLVPLYYTDHARTAFGANAPGPSSAYSTFLMTYGVWYVNSVLTGTFTETYTFLARESGTYTWEFACDDNGSFSIDGNVISTVADNNYTSSVSGTVSLSAGIHTISWTVDNERVEGAVGIRITNAAGFDVWSTLYTMTSTWAEVGRVAIQDLEPNVPYALQPNYFFSSYLIPSGQSYASYFQNSTAFWVTNDGYGNLSIVPSNLQNLSGDSATDITLSSAQYLFYYYTYNSEAISQIGLAGPTTLYFTGFDYLGNVTTITVSTPGGGLHINESKSTTYTVSIDGTDGTPPTPPSPPTVVAPPPPPPPPPPPADGVSTDGTTEKTGTVTITPITGVTVTVTDGTSPPPPPPPPVVVTTRGFNPPPPPPPPADGVSTDGTTEKTGTVTITPVSGVTVTVTDGTSPPPPPPPPTDGVSTDGTKTGTVIITPVDPSGNNPDPTTTSSPPAPVSAPTVTGGGDVGGGVKSGEGAGEGGGGCPAPWIKITLADKSVIEAKDVKVGMQVYTRHESEDVWGNYPVIGVKPGRDLRWKIDFEDGRQFIGTFNHPLHTQDRGWVEIRDLKIGDQITEPGGTFAIVKSAIEDGQGDIIKITVEDAHTYLTEGFLSHNKDYTLGAPIEED